MVAQDTPPVKPQFVMENKAAYTFDEVQLPPEPEWGPSAFDTFLPERPAQAHTAASDDHKFKLWRGKDILNAPPKEWYYKGIVGAHDTVIVFGQSGSGKTYLMLDLALAAVSSGPFAHCFEFEGERALRVAYMTHEGTSGIGARLASMTSAIGLGDNAWDNLYIYTDILQFTLPNGKFGVNQFIEQALADTNGEGFDILILDHLSATLPGKGDSDGPTATLVDMEVDRLKCALNCSVIFGHHTGWNNDRSRGMSNYRDVSDQMIKVEGLDNPHTMNCDKVKDGKKWDDKFFKIVEDEPACHVEWYAEKPKSEFPEANMPFETLVSICRDRPGLSSRQLTDEAMKRLGMSDKTARAKIDEAIDLNYLQRQEPGKKGQSCHFYAK